MSCQELAKYGLPRGCAEHNLLLMMQVRALFGLSKMLFEVYTEFKDESGA